MILCRIAVKYEKAKEDELMIKKIMKSVLACLLAVFCIYLCKYIFDSQDA